MKKASAQITAVLLLITACTAALSACGDTAAGSKDSSAKDNDVPVVTNTDTADLPEAERLLSHLPKADFDGYTFRVLHWHLDGWESRDCRDIYAETETGDVLNDAVYKRNQIVGEAYNVNISLQNVDYAEISKILRKTVESGEDAWDLAFVRLYEAAALLPTGIFLNFYDIPNIDLTKSWWDQNSINCLTIDGKLYLAASDITIEDKNATASILFNKTLAANYDIPDLYTMVSEGKWTIDQIQNFSKLAASDINGDGVMDGEDIWGFLGGDDVGVSFFFGGEGSYISRDETGSIHDIFPTEHNISLTQRIQALMSDTSCFYNHHSGTQKAKATDDNEYRAMFANGKGLFYWSRLDDVTALRALETDFGILPTPKYSEDQTQYASLVSKHITALMSVPKTVEDPSRTGLIMEALAAVSESTVQPAYYELALKSKYLRDDASADMLDLIFANRKYDLGEIIDLGGWATEHNKICRKKNGVVSSAYEKRAAAIEKAVQALSDAIAEHS